MYKGLTALFCLILALAASPARLLAQDDHGHGHEDDATIGFTVCVDETNKLGVEFDGDEVFELHEVDGVLVGWAGDEPGFNTLEEDEPDEGFFALQEGANIVLEVVSISPGFKAHTPGFEDVLDEARETWEMGAAPFDTHPEWHIDPADPGYDDHDEVWTITVRLTDTGATNYEPSEPFSIQFTREEEHGHGHEDDATIGFTVCVDETNKLGVEFDADEVFELHEVDGVITGWAGDEPGFNTLEEDEPDEGFFALQEGANIVLEVVSISPGFKAHTPGFADILDESGETWDLGAAPFDTHPEWHIDPADPGYDDHDEVWTITVRLTDTGATNYEPSEPFSIQFTREEEHGHGHEDDATIGFTVCVDETNHLGVEFEEDEVFGLHEVDGVITGWAGDEPGFNTLEEDEPDEGFFALQEGANIVLEVVSISPGFKAHTPGFADILDEAGETWELGAAPFDTHPEWHIDPADPGYDDHDEVWTITVRLIDTGTTNYEPSAPFSIQFTREEEHHGHVVPGDFNLDAEVDLSDSIGLLAFLFLGEGSAPCAEGDASHHSNEEFLDWNGDHQVDISDVIAMLGWSFLGEAPHELGGECQEFEECPDICEEDDDHDHDHDDDDHDHD